MTLATEFLTYAEIEALIEAETDLDIGEDSFINQAEMMGYVNKAVDRAEQLVHTLYEDYYLARDTLALESGTEEYALPTDIYAHKIRGLVDYTNGDVIKITRERDWEKFTAYRLNKNGSNGASGPYKWFPINETPGSPMMLIAPTPTASRTVERWYHRQANRITLTTDVYDIPEGKGHLLAFLRERVVWKKTHGNPESASLQTARADLAMEEQLLVETLTNMVVDGDTEVEPDFRHYEEHN